MQCCLSKVAQSECSTAGCYTGAALSMKLTCQTPPLAVSAARCNPGCYTGMRQNYANIFIDSILIQYCALFDIVHYIACHFVICSVLNNKWKQTCKSCSEGI